VQASESTDDTGPQGAIDTPCQLEPVQFAFDADALDNAARNVTERNTECMRERRLAGAHLTGHCDPRGTEEYNLALGDRRARAVMQYMISLGVSGTDLSASSMGEEMARGNDEATWTRDRRVDIQPR
jgi:peptidoglycan-associated lipoprotein